MDEVAVTIDDVARIFRIGLNVLPFLVGDFSKGLGDKAE
jgi:hypothetical protein